MKCKFLSFSILLMLFNLAFSYEIRLRDDYEVAVPQKCESDFDLKCFKCLMIPDEEARNIILSKFKTIFPCDLNQSQLLELSQILASVKNITVRQAQILIFRYTTKEFLANKAINTNLR